MPLFEWEKVTRDSPEYNTCLAVTTAAGSIIGGATGSIVPVAGTLAGYSAGALWGFVGGYLLCPYLAPAVRKKLESGSQLSHVEVKSAAEAMSKYAAVQRASDAVKLLGMVKLTKITPRSGNKCLIPSKMAKDILMNA
jgi:proteasome assembly chaperone (PAC2) family protein